MKAAVYHPVSWDTYGPNYNNVTYIVSGSATNVNTGDPFMGQVILHVTSSNVTISVAATISTYCATIIDDAITTTLGTVCNGQSQSFSGNIWVRLHDAWIGQNGGVSIQPATPIDFYTVTPLTPVIATQAATAIETLLGNTTTDRVMEYLLDASGQYYKRRVKIQPTTLTLTLA